MNFVLVMFKSDGARRDFPVHKNRVVIGRKNSCDLRIPLTSVSRQHCEIVMIDGDAKLRDLGSSNGTYVNASRVQEHTLSAGDEITVGPVVFTVVIDGVPADIEPVRTIVSDTGAPAAHSSAITTATTEAAAPVQPPTVDLDDPISALEALVEDEADDSSSTLTLDTDDELGGDIEELDDLGDLQEINDSDDSDFDIELLSLDDDEDNKR